MPIREVIDKFVDFSLDILDFIIEELYIEITSCCPWLD